QARQLLRGIVQDQTQHLPVAFEAVRGLVGNREVVGGGGVELQQQPTRGLGVAGKSEGAAGGAAGGPPRGGRTRWGIPTSRGRRRRGAARPCWGGAGPGKPCPGESSR